MFAVIGTTWGSGDGSTTFNVPNSQGKVSMGVGTNTDQNGHTGTWRLGDTGGEYNHQHDISASNVQAHIEVENNTAEHIGYLWVDEKPTNGWTTNTRTKFGGQPVGNSRVSSYGAGVSGKTEMHNTMQPFTTYNKIIRAK